MPRTPLTAGLLLMALASACTPGAPERPSSPASGLSISGTVGGSSPTGALIRASGPVVRTVLTDFAGRFELADLPRGEYALTAVPGNNVFFTPASRYVTLFDRDVPGQDFESVPGNVIYGIVSDGTPSGGIGGVAVNFVGPVTMTVVTDANGFYRASRLPGGTYAVATAAVLGRYVVPNATLVPVSGGTTVALNFATFASAGPTRTISGTVAGPVVQGIEIAISNPLGSTYGNTRTDASGHYAFVGLQDPATYLVTAAPSPGLMLRRRGRSVPVAGADVVGVDFEQYAPPTPRWAYVTARPPAGGSAIYQYVVGAGGSLAPPASALPATVPFDSSSGALSADPSGHYLYAASSDTSAVHQFTIGDDGQLTAMAPATVACTSQPRLLAMDPAGAYLWVHNAGSGDLWTFPIGAGGALATTPSSTLTVGGGVDLAVHPDGKALYLVTTGAILQYAIAADGSLSALVPASVPMAGPAGSVITALALDPSGRFAYATGIHPSPTYSAWVSRFTADDAGRLTQVGTGGAYAQYNGLWDAGPAEIVAEPSGRFVYVGSGVDWTYGYGQQVQMYSYDAAGAIAGLTPLLANPGGSTSVLAVDPAGQALYIVNTRQATVGWLPIGTDGVLTTGGTVTTGNGPSAIAVVGR